MDDYDKLKSIIKAVSPDIIEPLVRFCPKCWEPVNETINRDKSRKIFSCTRCLHQHEEAIPEPGTIQLMNVLHTLWMLDPYNFYADSNGEFRTFARGGNESKATGIFWNRADDNLEHQSDETKRFLSDYLTCKENVELIMKNLEMNRMASITATR